MNEMRGGMTGKDRGDSPQVIKMVMTQDKGVDDEVVLVQEGTYPRTGRGTPGIDQPGGTVREFQDQRIPTPDGERGQSQRMCIQ